MWNARKNVYKDWEISSKQHCDLRELIFLFGVQKWTNWKYLISLSRLLSIKLQIFYHFDCGFPFFLCCCFCIFVNNIMHYTFMIHKPFTHHHHQLHIKSIRFIFYLVLKFCFFKSVFGRENKIADFKLNQSKLWHLKKGLSVWWVKFVLFDTDEVVNWKLRT